MKLILLTIGVLTIGMLTLGNEALACKLKPLVADSLRISAAMEYVVDNFDTNTSIRKIRIDGNEVVVERDSGELCLVSVFGVEITPSCETKLFLVKTEEQCEEPTTN